MGLLENVCELPLRVGGIEGNNITLANPSQSSNACSPIIETDLGIITSVRPSQLQNA